MRTFVFHFFCSITTSTSTSQLFRTFTICTLTYFQSINHSTYIISYLPPLWPLHLYRIYSIYISILNQAYSEQFQLFLLENKSKKHLSGYSTDHRCELLDVSLATHSLIRLFSPLMFSLNNIITCTAPQIDPCAALFFLYASTSILHLLLL